MLGTLLGRLAQRGIVDGEIDCAWSQPVAYIEQHQVRVPHAPTIPSLAIFLRDRPCERLGQTAEDFSSKLAVAPAPPGLEKSERSAGESSSGSQCGLRTNARVLMADAPSRRRRRNATRPRLVVQALRALSRMPAGGARPCGLDTWARRVRKRPATPPAGPWPAGGLAEASTRAYPVIKPAWTSATCTGRLAHSFSLCLCHWCAIHERSNPPSGSVACKAP